VCKTKDEDGKLPLHKAIPQKVSAKVILMILDAYLDAAKTPDEYGTFLLHLAIEFELPDCFILSLLAANTEACKYHDTMALLPFHKAIRHKLSESVILGILEANEIASEVPDANGILPIQMAVESNLAGKVRKKRYNKVQTIKKQKGIIQMQYHANQRCLRYFGFIANPNLTKQQNFRNALQTNISTLFHQPKNLTYHNLYTLRKVPPGTKQLLGLNLKYCLATNQLHCNIKRTL
jgi:hypothetical protein